MMGRQVERSETKDRRCFRVSLVSVPKSNEGGATENGGWIAANDGKIPQAIYVFCAQNIARYSILIRLVFFLLISLKFRHEPLAPKNLPCLEWFSRYVLDIMT